MYCKFCGKYIGQQYYCNHCFNYINDNNNILWRLIGFLFPLLGLILFVLWKENKPKTSLNILIWSIISFIALILFSIFYALLV